MICIQQIKWMFDDVFSLRHLKHDYDQIKYVDGYKFLNWDYGYLDEYKYYGFHSMFYSLVFKLTPHNEQFLKFLNKKVYARRFHIEITDKIYFSFNRPDEYAGYIYPNELYFNNHKTKQTRELIRGQQW